MQTIVPVAVAAVYVALLVFYAVLLMRGDHE